MATITIRATRDAYSAEHVMCDTMTIAELMDCLQEMADAYGEDSPVVISNDNGYTYGSLSWDSVDVQE